MSNPARPRARALAALALLAAAAPAAHAFIIIDTAGPRELFASTGDDKPFSNFSAKLSTKDKALTGWYVFHNGAPRDREYSAPLPVGTISGKRIFTAGANVKVKAVNGLEEFFKFDKTPSLEAGLLANWTLTPTTSLSAGDKIGPLHSFTIQAGGTYDSVEHLSPTANPQLELRTARHRSAYGSASYGLYLRRLDWMGDFFGQQLSLVFSAEARRQSNFADLPLVALGKLLATSSTDPSRAAVSESKSVRYGDLQSGTAYPFTAAFVVSHRADWYKKLPGVDAADEARFFWAPYYRYTASSALGDAKAAGLSLTIRLKTATSLKYPVSVFYEWATKPGKDDWQGKAGAGVTFTWGP